MNRWTSRGLVSTIWVLSFLVGCDDAVPQGHPDEGIPTKNLPSWSRILGDYDGDGFGDVGSAAGLYPGREWGVDDGILLGSASTFGDIVESGDFNGDGVLDGLDDDGLVRLLGEDLTPLRNVVLRMPGRHPAVEYVHRVPDLNGDGADELIASQPQYSEPEWGLHQQGLLGLWWGGELADNPLPDLLLPANAGQDSLGGRIAVGELTGDDLADLAVLSRDQVSIYEGTPLGFSEQPQAQFELEYQYWTLVLGDVDGDAQLDVVFKSTDGVTAIRGGSSLLSESPEVWEFGFDVSLSILAHRQAPFHVFGAAARSSPEQWPFYRFAVSDAGPQLIQYPFASGTPRTHGDLNGDGFPDTAIGTALVLGTAQGLGSPSLRPLPDWLESDAMVAVESLDGDGLDDVVSQGRTYGNAEIRFSSGQTVELGGRWVARNADVGGQSSLLLRNEDDRCYVTTLDVATDPAPTGWACGDVAIGDVNADGVVDTAGFRAINQVDRQQVIYLSDGTTGASAVYVPEDTLMVALGDVNGDGVDDLLRTPELSSQPASGWFGREGLDRFETPDFEFAIPSGHSVQGAGDLNGDGFADVWTVRASSTGYADTRRSLHLGGSSGITALPSDSVSLRSGSLQAWRAVPARGSSRAVSVGPTENSAVPWVLGADEDGSIQVLVEAVGSVYRRGGPPLLVPGAALGVAGHMVLSLHGAVAVLEDVDGDGFFAGTDCDDNDASVVPKRGYWDRDGDGFAGTLVSYCGPTLYIEDTPTDCDDLVASISPNATEICGDFDHDCDGLLGFEDPDVPGTFYTRDADGDGYAAIGSTLRWCTDPPYGWGHAEPTDCNDANEWVHPGSPEYCNGEDTDCNGAVDDAANPGIQAYADEDGDGWGDEPVDVCPGVDGSSPRTGDCAPLDPTVHPQADEIWYDGIDQDCDGNDDDQDGDGVPVEDDCDDLDDDAGKCGGGCSVAGPAPAGGAGLALLALVMFIPRCRHSRRAH